MKIGIIKETKVPEDNRVALTPDAVVALKGRYPGCEIVVQRSESRVYADGEYACRGVELVDSVEDCDVLFGIKEADVDTLIRGKHYFFFGHIAKRQPYNRPLIRRMMELGITFTDYEYLVDEGGERLCAFGWWAGVVGVYNTLRAYGTRYGLRELPEPGRGFTLDEMLNVAGACRFSGLKIVVTGSGKVSRGVQFCLEGIGARRVEPGEFLALTGVDGVVYTVLELSDMVRPRGRDTGFDREEFRLHPEGYESCFLPYAKVGNVLVCSHFWGDHDPVYLSRAELRDPGLSIRVIGDITCDINGSIQSTVRSTTHAEPFYDYNPCTGAEEGAFSSEDNITVMAVDTLPNALALDTSAYFGETLVEHVLKDILSGRVECSEVIGRATILKDGALTEGFGYLEDYARGL